MNEIQTEWVRRLRSGEYKQGMQYLNRDGKFCCLGVLCEMAVEQGVISRKNDYGFTAYDSAEAFPGISVLQWSGLADGFSNVFAWSLASMNDDGITFDVIADEIEENL